MKLKDEFVSYLKYPQYREPWAKMYENFFARAH